MEASDKVISVLLIKAHECATHHDELYLVSVVAQTL